MCSSCTLRLRIFLEKMDCQDHVAEMRKRKKERKTPLGVQPDEVKFGFKIYFAKFTPSKILVMLSRIVVDAP